MIDTTLEKTIPIREIPPEHIPGRDGKPVHPGTVSLWYRRGIRGVKLETLLVGGRLCTSIEALNRFYQAVSRARSRHPSHQPAAGNPRTERQRGRAVREAVKDLAKRGV